MAQDRSGIPAFEGVGIGHHTLSERPTGCTVVIFENGATVGVDVRGAAPGTRETDLLDPVNTVQTVNAIAISGGSAYGLDVAGGVMRYLEERGMGYSVGDGEVVVPIVPQAILFDLFIGGNPAVRPDGECGYQAAQNAAADEIAEGSVGAGAGATVGKLRGREHAVKAGIGVASITLESGLSVAAVVAVNALGDVVDPETGEVVAGARDDAGGFADARLLLRQGAEIEDGAEGTNTTLAIVITNAALTKPTATKIAQMAHDGLARTIYPVHTPFDGDVVFAAGTGEFEGETDVLVLGSLGADVVAGAVLRAVRRAEGVAGIPSVRDLAR